MDKPTSKDPSSYCQRSASIPAADWHLKVKDIENNVGLTKVIASHYCNTTSMKKTSSIHKLIQEILGSHELNDHTFF